MSEGKIKNLCAKLLTNLPEVTADNGDFENKFTDEEIAAARIIAGGSGTSDSARLFVAAEEDTSFEETGVYLGNLFDLSAAAEAEDGAAAAANDGAAAAADGAAAADDKAKSLVIRLPRGKKRNPKAPAEDYEDDITEGAAAASLPTPVANVSKRRFGAEEVGEALAAASSPTPPPAKKSRTRNPSSQLAQAEASAGVVVEKTGDRVKR